MTSTEQAAVDRMGEHLTAPFSRGADRLDLVFSDRVGTVEPYSFAEHRARFGQVPKPRYIVRALSDVKVPTTLTVHYDVPGGTPVARTCTVAVPAGTIRGTSLGVPLGADAATAVLRALKVQPFASGEGNSVARHWRLTALLGDLAALLWTISSERDLLTSHLARVHDQRTLAGATGKSLDLIGSDLGIPRLPPLPYTFDEDVVALYHFEEPAGVTTVADAMELYRPGRGHRGTATGVRFGAEGRFGTGVVFDGSPAMILIDHHSDFQVSTSDSLTVECFVKPAQGDWQGEVVAKHAQPGTAAKPGWALSVGHFGRGITRNARLYLSDGTVGLALYADLSLDTSRFHHLAGVLDRAAGKARLYVDGQLRATTDLGTLGTIDNTEKVLVGLAGNNAAAAYRGTIDELRISRAALTEFHPVLGENDASYTHRLALFRKWRLPTRENIEKLLNEAVGDIDGSLLPLVVEDANAPAPAGSRTVTVRPALLRPRESIDSLGRRDRTEAQTCGTAAQDPGFDRKLLANGSDPRVSFESTDLPAGAEPRLMRVGTKKALRAFADLLANLGTPGALHVRAGFDPAARDLRAVGRALVLLHPNVPGDRLAALAHRAGFSWVTHQQATGYVYASVAATTTLEIVDAPGGTASRGYGFDVNEGQTFLLRIEPPPPPDSALRWSVVHYGPGRARIEQDGTGVQPTLKALAAGRFTVQVELRRGARVFTATREMRIGLGELALNTSIAADGRRAVEETVAGTVNDGPFLPGYLTTFSDPKFTAATPDAARMQPALAARLTRLLAILGSTVTGQLRLVSGYNPAGTGLERVGRALVFDKGTSAVSMPYLAFAAHAAGFDYVRHAGGTVQVAHRAEDLVTISAPAEVTEGSTTTVSVTPRATPTRTALADKVLCVLNSGTRSVSFVDINSGRVLRTARTGEHPVGIAASPTGRYAYLAEAGTNAVTVLDTTTGNPAVSVALPARPVAIAHHPSQPGLVVAVAAGAASKLVLVSTATNAITAQIALPADPTCLALDPTGAKAWLALGDGALRVVTLAGSTVSGPIAMPKAVSSLAVGPAKAYVAMPELPGMCTVDTTALTITKTFAELGPLPKLVAFDPAASLVYLYEADSGRIQVRTADGELSQPPRSVRLPGEVTSLLMTPGKLYLTTVADQRLGGTDAVGVLDSGAQLAPKTFWALGTGSGERLVWSALPSADARARLDSTTGQAVNLIAERAGPVRLTARYAVPGVQPYTVRIGLSKYLEQQEQAGRPVVISKEKYDLVMNVLNEFHPIGVEIDTSVVRARVLELRAGLLDVFPAYTYPTYRLRGRLPARTAPEDS